MIRDLDMSRGIGFVVDTDSDLILEFTITSGYLKSCENRPRVRLLRVEYAEVRTINGMCQSLSDGRQANVIT